MTNERKKIKFPISEAGKNTPAGFHIEIDKIRGGLSVCVNQVSSVLDFCEEYAILKLGRTRVKVCGSGLSISVYENKIAEISGKVTGVEIL